ncbi:MAG: hypothetical protein K2Q14_03800 [Gammaproteobacteria bacterium]|nr:hypothetical protein [Gammaproteobacteria bacterium]
MPNPDFVTNLLNCSPEQIARYLESYEKSNFPEESKALIRALVNALPEQLQLGKALGIIEEESKPQG